jgi:ankyrin repeat protein
MGNIWFAAIKGHVGMVEWLVGQDPGLLDAANGYGMTPLMYASKQGHVGLVRCLLGRGAAINNAPGPNGYTALWIASSWGRTAVVKLLLERGGDPTIAATDGSTPLIAASELGYPQIVHVLLGHPSGNITVNNRQDNGKTALWHACNYGRWGIVRALLDSGADPTIADHDGITPMAVAKWPTRDKPIAEGRRGCVAALEVRSHLVLFLCSAPPSAVVFSDQLAEA